MKNIAIIIMILSVVIMASTDGLARNNYGKVTPKVRNMHPRDDSEVIIEPQGVEFKWRQTPVPTGGRRAFRFRLFKGFEYGSIEERDIHPTVTSVIIPSDVFEDGQLYSWEVSQRGQYGWSDPCHWSFTANKGK